MTTTFRRVAAARLLPLFVLALVAASCGGDDGGAEPTSTGTGGGMDMSEGETSFAFGEPGDAAGADRSVEIEARDIEFDPTAVDVSVGETITFTITNTGAAIHEFVIGDEAAQDEHETEMQEMPSGSAMHDEPNAVALQPGETKDVTWTFTGSGEVLFGCHQPGHYEAGMVGTFNVS